MTFSGDFKPRNVTRFAKDDMGKLGLFLSDKKTVILCDGQKKSVAGIVVNEKPNVWRRQELYFCRKYGLDEHIRAGAGFVCRSTCHVAVGAGQLCPLEHAGQCCSNTGSICKIMPFAAVSF